MRGFGAVASFKTYHEDDPNLEPDYVSAEEEDDD